MAKKKRSGGRVTPKGTKNPVKASKKPRVETDDDKGFTPPNQVPEKVNQQQGKVARPVSHNRGNR